MGLNIVCSNIYANMGRTFVCVVPVLGSTFDLSEYDIACVAALAAYQDQTVGDIIVSLVKFLPSGAPMELDNFCDMPDTEALLWSGVHSKLLAQL
jgi:hypothetical protein